MLFSKRKSRKKDLHIFRIPDENTMEEKKIPIRLVIGLLSPFIIVAAFLFLFSREADMTPPVLRPGMPTSSVVFAPKALLSPESKSMAKESDFPSMPLTVQSKASAPSKKQVTAFQQGISPAPVIEETVESPVVLKKMEVVPAVIKRVEAAPIVIKKEVKTILKEKTALAVPKAVIPKPIQSQIHPESTVKKPAIPDVVKSVIAQPLAPSPSVAKEVPVETPPVTAEKAVVPPASQALLEKKEVVLAAAGESVALLAPIAPVAPIPAEIKKEALGRYAIQVGSFLIKEEADSMVSKLKGKGHDAYLTLADLPNKGKVYRVRIGRYPDRPAAQTEAEKISREESLSFFITAH
ncbi:MAG: SPOR domain-containing protein [Nitrospirota bacterium]